MSTFSNDIGPEEEDGGGWGGLLPSAEERREARRKRAEVAPSRSAAPLECDCTPVLFEEGLRHHINCATRGSLNCRNASDLVTQEGKQIPAKMTTEASAAPPSEREAAMINALERVWDSRHEPDKWSLEVSRALELATGKPHPFRTALQEQARAAVPQAANPQTEMINDTRERKLYRGGRKTVSLVDRAAAVPAPGRETWRKEFPCGVIHQGYPDGTTCLERREYAIKNEKPHRFDEEYRQRHINYDRRLFCDNCWSVHLLFDVAGATAPPKEAE